MIMRTSDDIFDVAIIGGGPAGAALAGYLAKEHLRCIVLEKSNFPRPHVGESLVPASTRVFKDLNFLDKMEANNFPHKFGAVWTTANSMSTYYDVDWTGLPDDCHAGVRFSEREQAGVSQNYTYHVDRGKFDELLLNHAKELGAVTSQGVAVREIDFSDPNHVSISTNSDSESRQYRAKLIVDASGRNTFLGNKLKLKVMDPVFDQYAIHTWFEGFDRGVTDSADYIHIHFLPESNTWIWQIPISGTVTSFGVVTQKKNFAKSKQDREQFFWDCIGQRQDLRKSLENSLRIRPFSAEGDYSYSMKQICGDRWMLIGDASRFVDPIFSSGVSLALNSARLASSDIIKAAKKNDFRRESFRNYETLTRRGAKNWYEFISIYYRLNVLFTVFIRDPKYRLDVLKLLQGDVYDEEEAPVLTKMKEIVREVENTPRHIWHSLLGDLTVNAVNS